MAQELTITGIPPKGYVTVKEFFDEVRLRLKKNDFPDNIQNQENVIAGLTRNLKL